MKRKLSFISLSALLIALFWYGCQNDAREVERGLALQPSETGDFENGIILPTCGTTSWDLTAGQTIVVGDVIVENDADNIYITYSLDLAEFPDACFGALHAWVGSDVSSLPKEIDKRPAPGQLCKLPGGACPVDAFGQTSYTITISLEDAGVTDCDQSLYVITHAEVDLDCNPETGEVETAFGGPTPGGGSAWWFYGMYDVCCPTPCIEGAQLLATQNFGNGYAPGSGTNEMPVKIYSITSAGVSNEISNIVAPVNGVNTGNFNANAYDAVNQRFYFTVFGKYNGTDENYNCPLYFNDLQGNQVYAGDLIGNAASGTFYNGEYYYFADRTDDYYKVTFNPDGKIATDGITKIADVLGNQGGFDAAPALGFGDITVNPVLEDEKVKVYGTATALGAVLGENANTPLFFKMNLDGTDIELITTGNPFGAGSIQIAFGADGVLYGVNAQTSYELYSIDPTNGNSTFIKEMPVAFSDLAAGPACP